MHDGSIKVKSKKGEGTLFSMIKYTICIYTTWERKPSKQNMERFNAIKLKPLLLKGSVFEGGEKMTVWVSDDANHIPIRIESPIVVGKVKVDMMSNKNLRYPLTSLIKVKGG